MEKKLMTSKICVNTTKPEKQYNISVGALVNPVANEATEPKVFLLGRPSYDSSVSPPSSHFRFRSDCPMWHHLSIPLFQETGGWPHF